MVARSENIDRTVEEEGTPSTNCLMLLTRVGECGGRGGGESRRVYTCKTCMKAFSSFQALGGHRASHNKPINNYTITEDHQSLSSLSSGSDVSSNKKKSSKQTKSHTCPICGSEFHMGQALGGHMRKHRDEKHQLVTRSLFPEETTTKKPSGGKRVVCLDSLDGEDEVSTKLRLGI